MLVKLHLPLLMRFAAAGVLLGAALLSWPTGAAGDGVVRDGVGAVSSGRGGTNIAHFDNGAILLDNPAAMVNIPGCALAEISADILVTDLHYSDRDPNDANAEHKPFPLGQLAYISKTPDGDWAYGIGVFAPAGFGAEYDLNGPAPVFGVHRYKSLGALLKVLPGVACRVTDNLSIGATLGVAASHAELEGPHFFQSAPFTGTPTVFDLQATGAAMVWSVGAQYRVSDATVVGAAFNSESRFGLDGSASAIVPGLGQSRFDADVDLTWPCSAGVGIAHSICPHRRVSADVIWFNWSDAFDSVDVRLSNPSNPVFAAVLGPSFVERYPLAWRDGVSLRVGYEEVMTDCNVLRFGYAYHRNQIPEATLTPFIPAILEHAFSVGWGTCWHDWNLDFAYQFSFGRDREVGQSDIAGGDFSFSRVEAQAHWLFVSLVRHF
jgi:long-chain fatty acid transport protein